MAKNIKPTTLNDIRLYDWIGCKWSNLGSPHKISLPMIGDRTLSQQIYLMIQEACANLVSMYLRPAVMFHESSFRAQRDELAMLSSVLKEIDYLLHKTLVYDPPYGPLVRLPEYVLDSKGFSEMARSYEQRHGITKCVNFVYKKTGHGVFVNLYNSAGNTIALINGIVVLSTLKLSDEGIWEPKAEFERVFNISRKNTETR